MSRLPILSIITWAPFVAALLMAFASSKEGQSSSRLALFLGLGIAALRDKPDVIA